MLKPLLQLGPFRRLAAAYGLNELATQVAAVVLVVLVYRRTGSALGAAVFFICTQFLPAFASPPVVAWLERFSTARVLPLIYGLEALLYLGLAAAVAAGVPLVPLLALALVDGILALAARSRARAASVAVTSAAGLLREGNALINWIFSVGYMAGPGLGGLFLLVANVQAALVAVAVGFGLIAMILRNLAGYAPAAPSDREDRPLRETLRYVRRDRLIRNLLATRAVAIMFFTISIPCEIVLAQHALHAGSGGYALLLTAWGSGTVLGSAIYSAARRARAWKPMALGAALLGAGFVVMAASPTLVVAILGAVTGGAGNGVDAVASRTILQEATDPARMTMVTALNESLWQAVPGAGILLGGGLAQLAGARFVFALAGGASLALVAWIWLAVRPLEHAPVPAPEASAPSGAELHSADQPPNLQARLDGELGKSSV